MLKYRLRSAFIIIAALIVAACWVPPKGILLALLAISGVAIWEFYALLGVAGIPHFRYVGLIGCLALIASTWASIRLGRPNDMDWLVLYGITASVFLRQFPQKNNLQPLVTIAGTLLGVMYVPFLFNFITKLLLLWGDVGGRLLVLYLIVVVKLTDVGAYFVGCRFGRHKLIPRISPAKTWEGCFGGIATGLLGSLLYYFFARSHLGFIDMRWSDAAWLGLILSVAGIVGDLTESLFKRASGVKDSGRIIQGMGGVLDVIDSLLFAAPALYAYARLFMTWRPPL